jgi:hypothetical protein
MSEFQDKIKSLQFPRKPHVEQKSAEGGTQTYHTSGRVDANVVATPVVSTLKLQNSGGE